MRISLILFIFLFFTNCSSIKSIETTAEDLKKEGSLFLEKKEITIVNKEIELIAKILPIISKEKHIFINNDINLIVEKKVNIFKKNKKNLYKKNILVTKNKIFFIDDKSNFYILTHDLKILKKIRIYKKKQIKGYFLKFSLFEYNNIIYFSDNLGGMFSFDLKQNFFLWKNNFQIPFYSNILFYKKNIYTVNANGKVFSFDAKTGEINWTLETGSQAIKSNNGYKIAISSDKLFFTNDLAVINCIDLLKQKFLWNLSINNFSSSNAFEVSDITSDNNNLYLSSNYGGIMKINKLTGALLWNDHNNYSILNPIINHRTISTITSNGIFTIYAKKNGKILFKKNIFDILNNDKIKKKNLKINNISSLFDNLIFTSNNGYFLLMNFNNLNSITYKKISKQIISNIELSKENIFFIADSKYLYKIK